MSIELPFGWTTRLVTIALVRYGDMSYQPDQVTAAQLRRTLRLASLESTTDLEHREIDRATQVTDAAFGYHTR